MGLYIAVPHLNKHPGLWCKEEGTVWYDNMQTNFLYGGVTWGGLDDLHRPYKTELCVIISKHCLAEQILELVNI